MLVASHKSYRKAVRWMVISALVLLAAALLPRVILVLATRPRVFGPESAPSRPIAIVFGAGISPNGRLSAELNERVTTAVKLYQAGKVEKLLMSGDNRFEDYNEPAAMLKSALAMGVPSDAVVLDYAGRRTYDTCYRAGSIFGIRDAVLVTQQYHLPRALFICNSLGLEAIGVSASQSGIIYLNGNVREFPASISALVDVYLTRPEPVLGDPEPIFSAVTGRPKR